MTHVTAYNCHNLTLGNPEVALVVQWVLETDFEVVLCFPFVGVDPAISN